MRTIVPIMAATMAIIGSPLAAASAPVTLDPTSKWNIDYDTNSCHLARSYGADKERIVLRLTRYMPGDEMEMTLFGKAVDTNGQFRPMTVDFGPVQNPSKREALVGTSGDLPMVYAGDVRLDDWERDPKAKDDGTAPEITPEMEGKVTDLMLRLPNGHQRVLKLGSMRAPMQALRTCVTDLVKSWGYPPDTGSGVGTSAVPRGSPDSWIRDDDYPTDLLLQGASGLVRFRLDVDEQGKARGCAILSATKPLGFADLTCRLLIKRASFQPALDKSGKAVAAFYVNAVRWQMAH